MNMQNSKKLTTVLLACALVTGGAVGVSAAEPSTGSEQAVSATVIKAIALEPSTVAKKGDQRQNLRIIPIGEKPSDRIASSVVPLTAIVEAIEANDDDQTVMKAIPLVPAKVIPLKKIVMK